MPAHERPPAARVLNLLARGDLEIEGRLPWSSNHSFLATCRLEGEETGAVYKPGRGERRLWDFPEGIYRREVAAYELSCALEWGIVPETVIRDDAPLGPGSVQRFVPADFSQHHFTLVEDERHHDGLRAVCAFDIVANNTDRKSGHCLLGEDGRIWAIDNGLCFHAEPKLRTVIWEFAGERVPPTLLGDIERVASSSLAPLRRLLSGREMDALRRRAGDLVRHGRFPAPDPREYHYPWPLV